MQNTIKWRLDQFWPTYIWNPWSNETDAILEDSACTVQVLLFFPIDANIENVYINRLLNQISAPIGSIA